jgi:hypothetical protein
MNPRLYRCDSNFKFELLFKFESNFEIFYGLLGPKLVVFYLKKGSEHSCDTVPLNYTANEWCSFLALDLLG